MHEKAVAKLVFIKLEKEILLTPFLHIEFGRFHGFPLVSENICNCCLAGPPVVFPLILENKLLPGN